MDKETIKIKCPRDGGVLMVKRVPGIENKHVTCPICKTKMLFTEFKIISEEYSDDTQYGNSDELTQYGGNKSDNDDKTPESLIPGKLTVKGTTKSYQLRPGLNIIGRTAAKSKATIQVDCPSKRMSREHLAIEVKRLPKEGYVHYARLFKSQVNATYINGLKLEAGDVVVLTHGNTISLPDVEMVFTLPDGEETDL